MKNYIPTINISSLIKNNFNSATSLRAIKKIERACIDVGFFQITHHGIKKKDINNITKIGNNFFNSNNKIKMKLAPKKWNKKNKNIYRGYFPNDVNGKEGLDIGDLKVTKKYVSKIKNQYIEYLALEKVMDKNSIKILADYFGQTFDLGQSLFKSIIKLYKKDVETSKLAFSRL